MTRSRDDILISLIIRRDIEDFFFFFFLIEESFIIRILSHGESIVSYHLISYFLDDV